MTTPFEMDVLTQFQFVTVVIFDGRRSEPEAAETMKYLAELGLKFMPATLDVDGAIAVLKQAGFGVHRLPKQHRGLWAVHPCDDLLEVVSDSENWKAAMESVEAVVTRFGGDVDASFSIDDEYTPFEKLIKGDPIYCESRDDVR